MYKTQRYYFTCKQAPDQIWRQDRGEWRGLHAKKASGMGSRAFSQHKLQAGAVAQSTGERKAVCLPMGDEEWPPARAPGSLLLRLQPGGRFWVGQRDVKQMYKEKAFPPLFK